MSQNMLWVAIGKHWSLTELCIQSARSEQYSSALSWWWLVACVTELPYSLPSRNDTTPHEDNVWLSWKRLQEIFMHASNFRLSQFAFGCSRPSPSLPLFLSVSPSPFPSYLLIQADLRMRPCETSELNAASRSQWVSWIEHMVLRLME